MTTTWANILTDAFNEIGVFGPGETPDSAAQTFALNKANRILDNWNAEGHAVYADTFTNYTLTPNLDPHTIGPTGTFVVTQRPVEILSAALVLTSPTPDQYTPITINDTQWWVGLPTPNLATSWPTNLFYNPSWPNGDLYFWPVPTIAYSVRLQKRVYLAQVATTDTFTLPPGYKDAITLTLAEDLQIPYPKASGPDPLLAVKALQARARVFSNNTSTPRLITVDAGMPTHAPSTFNYLNREF